ncbi:hypothetical protein L1049_025769 [Liquidambar formosana]|uniref:CUE domain-containing protein n=1 Tax=Liquidambar formosana TaxID=63359 RepID=A0AAP0R6U3_LIQFO
MPPLRPAAAGGDGGSASGSRVRKGENGDWVSSKVQGGSFVNYLPQDEAVAAGLGAEDGGLDPVESQRVVDVLNRELSRLLKLSPRDFWREVASDVSLLDFLDSFLQFRSRWYDFPHHGAKGIVAGVIVGEFELSRRVFMVLYRISSNRDPGARASDILSPKDYGVLLQEKKLLDLPKLLDICAIYGHQNEDLTRLLVVNAIKSQPRINENLTAVVSHFLSIVHTMHQRCSSSVEALVSSGGSVDHGSSRLHTDFLEVMDFINDAIVSMDAFVSAYKPAAVFFSCLVEMRFVSIPPHFCVPAVMEMKNFSAPWQDCMIHCYHLYSEVFESFILQEDDGLQKADTGILSNIAISLKMLSMRIVNFGWKLLDLCYLSDEAFEGSLPFPDSTMMFPAKVEDPIIRADILVQTFREISGVLQHVWENQNRGTFLQDVEKNYKIMSRLENLRSSGWIFMDDEQFQYLSGIMMHSLEATIKEPPHTPTPVTSNKVQMDEDAAIVESKISQIKEIFPDYGKGFVSACLEVYNQNPEEVIQRILEGTLHEDLQSLDTSLEKIPPHKKSKVDLPYSNTLDSRNEKDLEKTATLISQYEYEDEYDDSFDDLGLSVVDSGLEESEILGDKISSNQGKSWGMETESSAPNASNAKWGSRKKPQFYVKDGRNYSYKVEGSVAVANINEASLVNQAQKELIYGLGRGGNLPLGAVKKLTDSHEEQEQDDESEVSEAGGRGNPGNSRGRGRRGGGRNNYRKDRAMRKHFSGLSGF